MSRDSSGNYTLPAGVNPVVAATTITDDWANTTLNDVATALTDSLDRQGRGAPLANISWGNFKITSLAAGTASTDSVRYGQVVNQDTATIASASTVDLASTIQSNVTVSGTTTITSFGTGAASGIIKVVTFTGALSLTHSSTLICPNSANLSVAAGDSIFVRSEGSNVWRVVKLPQATLTIPDGSVSAPGLAFANDANCGLFRTGADNWGLSGGGFQFLNYGATANSVLIQVPEGTGAGITIKTADMTSLSAGTVTITTGTSTSSGLNGGTILVRPGSVNSATAGTVTVQGGPTSGGSQTGGLLTLAGGDAAGASSTGGEVKIRPGTPGAGGAYGDVNMVARANTVLRFKGTDGHIYAVEDSVAPTIASGGGTSPTIAGNDNAFVITLGTSPGTTAIVINFNRTWTQTPRLVLVQDTTGVAFSVTPTTTNLTLTPAASLTTGARVAVLCLATTS